MPKILIVDDAAFSRTIIRKIIESEGYHVIEAASGTEAIKMYVVEKPDAVTMDLLMPDMDGIEAVKKIRSLNSDAKIIVCSTDKQKFRKNEAKEAGAIGFVAKPIDADEFLITLKEIIG